MYRHIYTFTYIRKVYRNAQPHFYFQRQASRLDLLESRKCLSIIYVKVLKPHLSQISRDSIEEWDQNSEVTVLFHDYIQDRSY